MNDDPVHDGVDQFFPSTAIDPATGFVYILFYDRRADPENHKFTITLARSTDGGLDHFTLGRPGRLLRGLHLDHGLQQSRLRCVDGNCSWRSARSQAECQALRSPATHQSPRCHRRLLSLTSHNSTITSSMLSAIKVEYAHERKTRQRNKIIYRIAHWPIWIWVFFLAPGPLTFDLFAHGPSGRNLIWLTLVLAVTGVAGLYGQLPGVEPRPYILRFCEDKPTPLYRRICYTFAWNALLSFALLNLLGLLVAVIKGKWYLQQIYRYGYFPVFLCIVALGFSGLLPRVKNSTEGEGTERRYFYGTVWSVTFAQALLLALWKVLPRGHAGDLAKLSTFVIALSAAGLAAAYGLLPRTRPILPGELMVAD